MADFGAITRELPVGESTCVMASIKMEKSVASEEGIPRAQAGFLFGAEPSGCLRKNLGDVGGLRQMSCVGDLSGLGVERDVPVDYSIMQERLHGSFSHLTQASDVVGLNYVLLLT